MPKIKFIRSLFLRILILCGAPLALSACNVGSDIKCIPLDCWYTGHDTDLGYVSPPAAPPADQAFECPECNLAVVRLSDLTKPEANNGLKIDLTGEKHIKNKDGNGWLVLIEIDAQDAELSCEPKLHAVTNHNEILTATVTTFAGSNDFLAESLGTGCLSKNAVEGASRGIAIFEMSELPETLSFENFEFSASNEMPANNVSSRGSMVKVWLNPYASKLNVTITGASSEATPVAPLLFEGFVTDQLDFYVNDVFEKLVIDNEILNLKRNPVKNSISYSLVFRNEGLFTLFELGQLNITAARDAHGEIKTASSLSLSGDGAEIASTKVDEHSGSWTWAGFDPRQGEVISAETDLLTVAETIIRRYERELGFRSDEILTQEGGIQTPYPSTRLITLRRQHLGTPIKGAFINIFFAIQSDGTLRLSEIVNNSYGPISLASVPAALLGDDEVQKTTGVEDFTVRSKQAVIVPLPENGTYTFRYATEFQLLDKLTGEEVNLTVDNSKKSILEAYSNHVYETTEIQAEFYNTSYVFKDLIARPLEYLQILDGSAEKATDALGKIDLSGDKAKVVLHNTHNSSKVFAATDKRNPISFDITVGADGKTLLKFGEGNSSGLNVYASVTETINYAAKYLSEKELSLIRKGFDSIVDIDDECNAFYDGKLNFFKQSSKCGNTGLISNVVKHEWGHGLDDFLGPTSRANNPNSRGITDGAYSEAIGDILAGYIARSPNMGEGFYIGDPAPLRQLKNNATHPPQTQAERGVHTLGLVTGGSFWDLHENLANLYGPDGGNDIAARLFFRHLITSDRYLDAYQAVLRVDDDDNNPMTKSPNYCAITRSFERHNITGGEKAGNDCLDTDQSIRVKIDEVEDEGKISLVLSAGGANLIVACPGTVTSCTKDSEGYAAFPSADGDDVTTAKGPRKFYSAKAVLDVKSNPTFTFFSLSKDNVTLAKRAMAFKATMTESSAKE